MKGKFNIKLTAFLVSLFVSLLIIILGNKNKYCLAFGFIVLSLSVVLYVLYNDDKTKEINAEIEERIAEIENDNEMPEDERDYAMQELFLCQIKLMKRKKRITIIFYLFAIMLFVLGFFSMF